MSVDAVLLVPTTAVPPKISINRKLRDGVIVRTHIRYDSFEYNPMTSERDPLFVRYWIRNFLGALAVGADARGVLIFPDLLSPDGEDVASVVEQVGADGIWVRPLGEDEHARYAERLKAQEHIFADKMEVWKAFYQARHDGDSAREQEIMKKMSPEERAMIEWQDKLGAKNRPSSD